MRERVVRKETEKKELTPFSKTGGHIVVSLFQKN